MVSIWHRQKYNSGLSADSGPLLVLFIQVLEDIALSIELPSHVAALSYHTCDGNIRKSGKREVRNMSDKRRGNV